MTDRAFESRSDSFNNDGNVDLVIANSCTTSIRDSHLCVAGNSTFNHLYTGDGAGNFSSVTSGVVATDSAASLDVAWGE